MKSPIVEWDNFIITEDLGHVGQWKDGECRLCGEHMRRQQGGDLDDWWVWDFERMLEGHVCKGKV